MTGQMRVISWNVNGRYGPALARQVAAVVDRRPISWPCRRSAKSRNGDAEVVHGEVHSDAAAIWLHRVSADQELASPSTLATATGGLGVDVEDVDAHCDHARAAGARIDSEPTDQPYGRRGYGARDPEGHRWWFGTPLG